MCALDRLFANNRAWAHQRVSADPEYFTRLARQQAPKFLWIGCSDSRVPANQIIGLEPGEVFVHRNIANVVVHSDLNCLSVVQFAVENLRVEHILVVGHYGCGGVQAVADQRPAGLADNWLRHVEDVALLHRERLLNTPESLRARRLVELNIVEQVANLCRSTVVRNAWQSQQALTVQGLVYGLEDGLLRAVGVPVSAGQRWEDCYQESLAQIEAAALDSAAAGLA